MHLYFLTQEDVLEIHADQIKRYGGKTGIRDNNLLLSAIAQPCSMFSSQYLHRSIYTHHTSRIGFSLHRIPCLSNLLHRSYS